MKPTEENLSAQQSLDLISSMIRQAKGNMQNNSFHFLLWGWTIAIANIGVYVMLKFTDIKEPFFMFAITIPAAVVSMVYGARQGRKAKTSTMLDQINMWMWISFGITCFILAIFGPKMNWQINPVIITMCAAPTLLSGIMLRFKPLQAGGLVFWVLGVTSFLVDGETQFLLAAIAVTFGYLVPGYLLKKSEL